MNISVVIPLRNAAHTIERAVISALESDIDDVVMVYDASEDDTYSAAHRLMNDSRVNLIHSNSQTPVGVCAARNIGITRALNDLIIPLDADDYFLPGGVQALRSAYQLGTWVYGGWEKDDGRHIEPPPIGMLKRKQVAQATFLFAKNDWLRVGGYFPLFNIGAEDVAFQRALTRAGVIGTRIPQAVYHYTDNPNGRASACQRDEILE